MFKAYLLLIIASALQEITPLLQQKKYLIYKFLIIFS